MLDSVSQSSGQIDTFFNLHMNATYISFLIGYFLFTIETIREFHASTLKRRGFFMLLGVGTPNYPTPRSMYSVLLATVMSICLKLNLTGPTIFDLEGLAQRLRLTVHCASPKPAGPGLFVHT